MARNGIEIAVLKALDRRKEGHLMDSSRRDLFKISALGGAAASFFGFDLTLPTPNFRN